MREKILALVGARSGMVFAPNRQVEADAGIARAMKRSQAANETAYLRLIRTDSKALDDLVEELTVGETHFLRDPAQMELLRSEVLPALARRRTPLRLWSAACATGEEAYSLAILLEQAGLGAGAVVLGTDISRLALSRARAASYSDWSMRGVSDLFLQAYFVHERKRRVLVDRIRAKVHFEPLNLVAPEPYSAVGAAGMDLILCRNVLIYFDEATVAAIAARLYESLAVGGALLTAGSDPLIGDHAPFEIEMTAAGLLYRRISDGWSRTLPPPPSVVARPSLPYEHPVPAPAVVAPAPLPRPDPGRDMFDQVTLVANGIGAFEADVLAQSAIGRHPLDAPLHYLRATLLVSLDRAEEAEAVAQRALYLDPSLAVAHFLLGTILRKRGARPHALRAFRNARDLCAGRAADEPLPAGAGERFGGLHSAAMAEMASLAASVA